MKNLDTKGYTIMKKNGLIVLFALLTSTALAQFQGLPIASGGGVVEPGTASVSAGAALGDDFNLYGGRVTFSPLNRLTVFGDLGFVDPDHGKVGLAGQAGVLFAMPLATEPVDFGVRATWGYTSYDVKGSEGKGDLKATGFNIGVVMSRDFDLLTPYVFLGFNFNDVTIKRAGHKRSKDETDIAVAAGVSLNLGPDFALYGEVAHVDDPFFALGLRRNF